MTRSDDVADDAPATATLPVSAPQPGETVDSRRRAALAKLGRTAVYAVPATVSLMAMTRSARAC
ncbi:hypothetical protein [Ancylobacter vacuolatus]|uniref:Uncharacterized protein n=1 Tax=Ancylobacter vacuolatus TaxID=223389 RepID=A0ABU0DL57_9HYPH|nr:hypothetical protein [Ancylobacter vacuolatus]MDQ0349167.1 hypothetical protein [Ancylobacter vacuolatus]